VLESINVVIVVASVPRETGIATAHRLFNILFPLLDKAKAVKKLPNGKDLSVDIDYLSDEPRFDVDIELYIRVGGALGAVCRAAIRAFKKAVKRELKKLENKK
jgi:hypothetical protein